MRVPPQPINSHHATAACAHNALTGTHGYSCIVSPADLSDGIVLEEYMLETLKLCTIVFLCMHEYTCRCVFRILAIILGCGL